MNHARNSEGSHAGSATPQGFCGLSETGLAVLRLRGIADQDAAEFLEPRLAGLSDPTNLLGRTEATERIVRAIRTGETIAIFGDYDVDGTTSATILADGIERLGGTVWASLANRFLGGYGLSHPALDRIIESGAKLLITCDCGSSDHERVERAKAAGIDVVVVDHHLVPKEKLPALAFLNPHQPGCNFGYKGMASAGLAFLLLASIRRAMDSKLDPKEWLDLVALGTVADVAPLDGDNRRLVRAGLTRIASSPRPGVVALRNLAKLDRAFVVSSDIGFRLAPRLNAAGRLGESELTLKLLRSKTLAEATELGSRIEQVNAERREIQTRMVQEASDEVRRVYGDLAGVRGIVVASKAWHRGVVGIVASRLVELFGCAALVIALDSETTSGTSGNLGHGSGRAPRGFPLYDALKEAQDLLLKSGGHQAAVGLTIEESSIEQLRTRFAAASAARWSQISPRDSYDLRLEPRLRLPTEKDLRLLEPFGPTFEEPRFLLEAKVTDAREVGEGHLKLELERNGERFSAFGFEQGNAIDRLSGNHQMIGTFRIDTYRGRGVELKLEQIVD